MLGAGVAGRANGSAGPNLFYFGTLRRRAIATGGYAPQVKPS